MRDLSAVLTELQRQRQEAVADVQRIDAAIAALRGSVWRRGRRAGRGRRRGPGRPAAKRSRRRRFTAVQRKAASERMKKYWAERRKAKASSKK